MGKKILSAEIYVDDNNIGFDVTAKMADYDEVCMFDTFANCASTNLSVNVTTDFIDAVLNKMNKNASSLNVLTIYVNLRQNVCSIGYSAKNSADYSAIPLTKGTFYYTCEMSGGVFYADAYSNYEKDRKRASGSIKIELRTYRKQDGSNWTYTYTYPQ